MIIEEHPLIMDDGSENEGLTKHYSNSGMMMRQVETGAEYAEAVDIYPCAYTYEETDIPIDPDDEATTEDYEAALAELGVDV